MRFMMLLPAPAGPLEKAVAAPNKEPVTAMHKFNEEIAKPGVLLAAEGLPGTTKGSRIPVSGGKRIVTDGPFTEAKEVIAGFWMSGQVERGSSRALSSTGKRYDRDSPSF